MAIKEGERGKFRPYGHTHNVSSASDASTNTLDAERADRISRLAGLERVATLRGAHQHIAQSANQNQQYQQGFFDNADNLYKSTVGSASATGSIGGSVPDSADKMSEDADDGISSAGLSDDGNASLVGFGEAASSSLSGPTSCSTRAAGVVAVNKQRRQQSERSGSPMDGVEDRSSVATPADTFAMDTTTRCKGHGSSSISAGGQEQAERIIGDTMRDVEGQNMENSIQGRKLGTFSFEER